MPNRDFASGSDRDDNGTSDRGYACRVSVKTKKEIPKEKIMDCIRQLKDVHADAPVEIGDILLENVAGTGIDIVATAKCKAASRECKREISSPLLKLCR